MSLPLTLQGYLVLQSDHHGHLSARAVHRLSYNPRFIARQRKLRMQETTYVKRPSIRSFEQ